MAKEGSVAPKERINVTFKPATGGAQEEIELPLKLMVLGDFTQRADDRKIMKAIFYVLRTGMPWRDLPER